MSTFIDLAGQRFGHWTVVDRAPDIRPRSDARWNCVCSCGGQVVVNSKSLRKGTSTKCRNCGWKDSAVKHTKHGVAGKSPLYAIWLMMRQRCTNSNVEYYRIYGGKGVRVCEEWDSFEAFQQWSHANGYGPGMSIDRLDSDGNYEPSNCEWVTKSENSRRAMRKRWGVKERPNGV